MSIKVICLFLLVLLIDCQCQRARADIVFMLMLNVSFLTLSDSIAFEHGRAYYPPERQYPHLAVDEKNCPYSRCYVMTFRSPDCRYK